MLYVRSVDRMNHSSRVLQSVVAHREQARRAREEYALSPKIRPLSAAAATTTDCGAIGMPVMLSAPSLHIAGSSNVSLPAKPSSAPQLRSKNNTKDSLLSLSQAAIIAAGQDEEKTGDEKVVEWQGGTADDNSSKIIAIASAEDRCDDTLFAARPARPTSAGRPPSPGLSKYAHIEDPKELRRLLQQSHSLLAATEKKLQKAEARSKVMVQQLRVWKSNHNNVSKLAKVNNGGDALSEEDDSDHARGGIGDGSGTPDHTNQRGGSVASDALRELSDIASSASALTHEVSKQLAREARRVGEALGDRWSQCFETAIEIHSVRELRALLMEAVDRLLAAKDHNVPGRVSSASAAKPKLFEPKKREASSAARHQQMEHMKSHIQSLTTYSNDITVKFRSVGATCGKHVHKLQEHLAKVVVEVEEVKTLLVGSKPRLLQHQDDCTQGEGGESLANPNNSSSALNNTSAVSFLLPHVSDGQHEQSKGSAKVMLPPPTPSGIAHHLDAVLSAVLAICDEATGVSQLVTAGSGSSPADVTSSSNVSPPTSPTLNGNEAPGINSRSSSPAAPRSTTPSPSLAHVAAQAEATRARVVHDRLSEAEMLSLYRTEKADLVKKLIALSDGTTGSSLASSDHCAVTDAESQTEMTSGRLDSKDKQSASTDAGLLHAAGGGGDDVMTSQPRVLKLLTACVSQMHAIYMHSLFGLQKCASRSKLLAADNEARVYSVACGTVIVGDQQQANRKATSSPATTAPNSSTTEPAQQRPEAVTFPVGLSEQDERELESNANEAHLLLSMGLLWESAMAPLRVVGCSSFLRLVKYSAAMVRHRFGGSAEVVQQRCEELRDQAPSFGNAMRRILAVEYENVLRKDMFDHRHKRELVRSILHQVNLLSEAPAARARFNWKGLLALHKFTRAKDLLIAATEKLQTDLRRNVSSPSDSSSSSVTKKIGAVAAARNEHWIKISEDLSRMATTYFADVAVRHEKEMLLLKGTLRMSADAAFDHLIDLLREARSACIMQGIDVDVIEGLGPSSIAVLHAASAEAFSLAGLRAAVFAAPSLVELPPKPVGLDLSTATHPLAAAPAMAHSSSSVSGDQRPGSTSRPASRCASSVAMIPTASQRLTEKLPASRQVLLGSKHSAAGISGLRALHAVIAPDDPSFLTCSPPAAVIYDVQKLRQASKENPWRQQHH